MNPTGTVKIICQECGKLIRTEIWVGELEDKVSHGICPECFKIKMAELDDMEVSCVR